VTLSESSDASNDPGQLVGQGFSACFEDVHAERAEPLGALAERRNGYLQGPMICLECANGRLHGAVCPVCYGTCLAMYVPISDDPWNLATENLFQGSAMHAIRESEFESVYTLRSIRDPGPKPGIPHRVPASAFSTVHGSFRF
jgi:hypothetical protein